jgi:DNA gyrase subunit B
VARKYVEVQSIIKRWARRYDEQVLEQMLYLPEMTSAAFDRAEAISDWTEKLQARLKTLTNAAREVKAELHMGAEGAPRRIDVTLNEHGITTVKHIQRDFFDSAEYRRIAELGKTLADLLGEGAYIAKADQRQDITDFKEAMQWLFEQAKKGQSIQRYKGLGEMNPEQLWDTTVNPETRRLMQVRIEDAVTADDIFTTLMGDQVEPRREFIEKNALAVANLDV